MCVRVEGLWFCLKLPLKSKWAFWVTFIFPETKFSGTLRWLIHADHTVLYQPGYVSWLVSRPGQCVLRFQGGGGGGAKVCVPKISLR